MLTENDIVYNMYLLILKHNMNFYTENDAIFVVDSREIYYNLPPVFTDFLHPFLTREID